MRIPSAFDKLPGKPQETVAVLTKDRNIRLLTLSPDNRVAAGLTEIENGNLRLRLWDPIAQKEWPALGGVPEWPVTLAFSPDGRLLAIGSSQDGTGVKLWGLEAGKWLAHLKVNRRVGSVVFAPDGLTLAVGTWQGTVQLWDVAASRQKATPLEYKERIGHVFFSPDGRFVGAGSLSGTSPVKMWNTATGKVLAASGTFDASGIAFLPDGRGFLAFKTGSRQEWEIADDLSSCRYKRDVPLPIEDWLFKGFTFTPGGRTAILIQGRGFQEYEFNPSTKELSLGSRGQLPGSEWLPGAFLTADGRHIAMFDGTGAIIMRIAALPAK